MKVLYNEEELFCTKAEILNFRITLPLIKLDMVGSSSAGTQRPEDIL